MGRYRGEPRCWCARWVSGGTKERVPSDLGPKVYAMFLSSPSDFTKAVLNQVMKEQNKCYHLTEKIKRAIATFQVITEEENSALTQYLQIFFQKRRYCKILIAQLCSIVPSLKSRVLLLNEAK